MASKFFHVQHEFRAGQSQQWWETAQAAMAPGGGWDEAVSKNLEAGLLQPRLLARLRWRDLPLHLGSP